MLFLECLNKSFLKFEALIFGLVYKIISLCQSSFPKPCCFLSANKNQKPSLALMILYYKNIGVIIILNEQKYRNENDPVSDIFNIPEQPGINSACSSFFCLLPLFFWRHFFFVPFFARFEIDRLFFCFFFRVQNKKTQKLFIKNSQSFSNDFEQTNNTCFWNCQ